MRKVIASEFVSLDEYSDQMTVNQGASPLLPIGLLVVSALVAWGRWPRTRTLFTNRKTGRLR